MNRGFQCGACGMSMSDPVDHCPICGDHFFWRVVPRGGRADAHQQQAFIQLMQSLTPNPIPENFLTHGGHLWLPDTYWQLDPEGHRLKQLDWVVDLDLHQHAAPEPAQATQKPLAVTRPEPIPAEDEVMLVEESRPLPKTVPAPIFQPEDDEVSPLAGGGAMDLDDSSDASIYLVDEHEDDEDEVPAAAWDQPTAAVDPDPMVVDVPEQGFHSMPMIVDEDTEPTPQVPAQPSFTSAPLIIDAESGEYQPRPVTEPVFDPGPRTAPMVVEGDNQFSEARQQAAPAPSPTDAKLESFFGRAEDDAAASAPPVRAGAPQAQPPPPRPAKSAATGAEPQADAAPLLMTERPFFKPVMVFLLMMFLSFSYLTLCYYRNQRTPVPPPVTMQGEADAVLP